MNLLLTLLFNKAYTRMRLLLGLIIVWGFITTHVQAYDLVINISNIKDLKGELLVSVCQDKQLYRQRRCTYQQAIVVNAYAMQAYFSDLDKAEYAVLVLQDMNNNHFLDKSFVGMPKEPFGFSNNPSVRFGPPAYKKTAFTLQSDQQIDIKLYNR